MAKKLRDNELKLLRQLAGDQRDIPKREKKALKSLRRRGLVTLEPQDAAGTKAIPSLTVEGVDLLTQIDGTLTNDEYEEWIAWSETRIGDRGPEKLDRDEWDQISAPRARALMADWRESRLPISHLLPEQKRRKWFGAQVIQRDIVKYIRCHVPTRGITEAGAGLKLLEIEYAECGNTIRWAGAQVLALLSVYGLVMAGWWNVVTKVNCDNILVITSSVIATLIAIGIGAQASHAHNYWLLASWRAAEIEEEQGFGSLARSALTYRKNTIDGRGVVSFFHYVYSKNVFPLLILAVHITAVATCIVFALLGKDGSCQL